MPRVALHATTELTKLRSPPLVFLAAPIPSSSVSSPKAEHSRRSPPRGHRSSIASTVSILVPSSTFPNQHPFFCPPPASSPRAPSCRGYGCRGRRSQPPPPVPIATKVESLHPPLSPRALGFENGGRSCRRLEFELSAMADGADEQEAALSVYSLVSANLVNTCRNIEPTNPKSHTSLCWAEQPKGSIHATHKQATQHLVKHVTHNQDCFLFSELFKHPILYL